jgi:hypothetical protein
MIEMGEDDAREIVKANKKLVPSEFIFEEIAQSKPKPYTSI